MKKKIKATELINGDIEYVSLVKNGAIRAPFKIIKSEKGNMVKFENLFGKEQASVVSAIAVSKSADLEKAKARIEKAGYSIESMEEQDGAFVFKQEDEVGEHDVAMKVDEDLAVIVNTQKSFSSYDYTEQSFSKLYAQAGVIPSLDTMMSVLWEVILNILHEGDYSSPEEYASAVKKAVKEFSNGVVSLVQNVPVTAFKIEKAETATKSETKEDTVSESKVKEDVVKEEAAEEVIEEVEKQEDQPEGEASQEQSQKEEEEKEEEVVEEEEAAEEAVEKQESSDVLSILKGLSEDISGLRKEMEDLGEIKKSVKELEGQITEVREQAQKAEDAVTGVTNASVPNDKEAGSVQKTEVKPLRDTGYQRA